LDDFGDEIALEEIFEGGREQVVVKHGDSEKWWGEPHLQVVRQAAPYGELENENGHPKVAAACD
jgi:hypothetical protein